MDKQRNHRGLSGSVQAALLLPLAIAVLLATLQWALLLWAEAVAMGAAQEAARSAAVLGGTEADGIKAGHDGARSGALSGVNVFVARGAEWSTATVDGNAVRLLPLVDVSVHQAARVPTERIS